MENGRRVVFFDVGKTVYPADAVYEDLAKDSGAAFSALLWLPYVWNDGGERTSGKIAVRRGRVRTGRGIHLWMEF